MPTKTTKTTKTKFDLYDAKKTLNAGKTKSKFFLWLRQSGEGCDYSIGCGEVLLPLPVGTTAATVSDAAREVLTEFCGDDEDRLDGMHALILAMHAPADDLVAGALATVTQTALDNEEARLKREAKTIADELAKLRARRHQRRK